MIFKFVLNFFLLVQVSIAEDCLEPIDHYLPKVSLPTIGLEVQNKSFFCFDQASKINSEALELFLKLKKENVFDTNNCVKGELFDNETDKAISALILLTTKNKLNIYASEGSQTLVLSNSQDSLFINKVISHLDDKDKIQIASAAIASSLIGSIIQRTSEDYRKKDGTFQHDKILHSNIGALINLGGVAGAYLAIETAGLGDKLELSKSQKKWTILLTGTFFGLLAGYGKERFYDYYHQDSHTYDPHLKGDMGATWLGGGILNAATGAVIFQF